MERIKWLLRRLKVMNMHEILWRMQQKLLQRKEYKKYYMLHMPVTAVMLPEMLREMKADAGKIPFNFNNSRFTIFEGLDIFGEFDYKKYRSSWSAGFQTENKWPEDEFSYNIPISQREDIGDIRTNWELNRHHQFACLAKNFFVTGNKAYLDELKELFLDWNAHNLFLHGVEWASAMEAGIRLLSWIYTYVFLCNACRKYKVNESELAEQLQHGILMMADHIVKHRSRFSSANNHLIIEMAAVGMAGILFGREEWVSMSIKILTEELPKQNTEDGVNREMSLHYQSFVMEAYGLLWLAMDKNHVAVPVLWERYLSAMSRYLADCCGDYGEVVVFGDNDEGKLLDLQGQIKDHYRYVLQLMGILLGRRYVKEVLIENICWLVDEEKIDAYYKKKMYIPGKVSFYGKGGYTILRSQDRKVLIGMDHAELGFGSIAAHGHADALSVQLYYCGRSVLVDSGTYSYHVSSRYRNELRAVSAHNTVCISGKEQADMLGPFLWGKRYQIDNAALIEKPEGIIINAVISYAGVRHLRKLEFDFDRKVVVEDRIDGACEASQVWHFSPEQCCITKNDQAVAGKDFIANSTSDIEKGSGVYSEQYGRKSQSDMLKIKLSGNRCETSFVLI